MNSYDLKKAQSTNIDKMARNDKKIEISEITQQINRNSEISS